MIKRYKIAVSLLTLVSLAAAIQHVSGSALSGFNILVEKCAVAATPVTTLATAPQSGTPLWSANMENSQNPGSGLAQWYTPEFCEGGCAVNNGGGIFNSGIASAAPSFDVAHAGQYSAMLKINTPNTPAVPESGTRLFRWLEPADPGKPELYYNAWYYFPQRYTQTGDPAWWNVFQWKSKSPTLGNNAIFALLVWNRPDGTMYFFLRGGLNPVSYDQTIKDIPVGQWTRIEAFYRCAPDSTGRVTIWQDGVQLFDRSEPTRYADGDCEWSVNNYSNGLDPNPATIYVDDAAICQGQRCP